MDSSLVPTKINIPWASSAQPSYVQPVADTTVIPGAASWTLGFGPETFLDPETANGTAPLGEYFNGVMLQLTTMLQWIQAGGVFQYDAVFQGRIGGYFKGCVLKNAAGTGFWTSTVENNMTDPDTNGAGWTILTPASYPWGSITGAPAFVLESEFTGANQQLAPTGFQQIPGGQIEQRVEFTVAAPAGGKFVTIPYPKAFLHTCDRPRVQATNETATNPGANNFIGCTLISHTLTNCVVAIGATPSGNGSTVICLDVRGT